MDFYGLTNLQFNTNIAIGVLIGVVFAALTHYALFKYIVHEVIEQVHTYSNGYDNIIRTVLYCLLTNLHFLIIGYMSCSQNPMTGVIYLLESDATMLLVTGGIIIYIEESRQTKLDPFLFSRDIGFYILFLVLFLVGIGIDKMDAIPIVLLALGFVYLIIQYLNNYLQYRFYKLFDLMEDEDFITPELLETQEKSKHNITELSKIITEQPQRIHHEVHNFLKLINRAVPKERDRRMYRRFAEIVVPIVKAIGIKDERDKTKRSHMYVKHWTSREDAHNLPQPQFLRIDQLSENSKSSYAGHTVNRGLTMQVEQDTDENIVEKIIRIMFYPLYFVSKLVTDMKYALYVLCLGVQFILLIFINSACDYLGKGWGSPLLFHFLLSHLLAIPNIVYSVHVSEGGDHDFYNLFLQSGIWKITLGLSIMQIVNTSVGNAFSHTLLQKIYVGIKLVIIICFAVYFGIRRLNIKKQSVKYLIGMFVVGYVGSLVLICFQ